MSSKSTVKIGPAIDAKLYREFVTVAKKNGLSQRYLLEKAIDHYIHNVVPSQHLVRPKVLEAHSRSNERFRDLYRRLARSRCCSTNASPPRADEPRSGRMRRSQGVWSHA